MTTQKPPPDPSDLSLAEITQVLEVLTRNHDAMASDIRVLFETIDQLRTQIGYMQHRFDSLKVTQ